MGESPNMLTYVIASLQGGRMPRRLMGNMGEKQINKGKKDKVDKKKQDKPAKSMCSKLSKVPGEMGSSFVCKTTMGMARRGDLDGKMKGTSGIVDDAVSFASEIICNEKVPGTGDSELCSPEDTKLGSGVCNLVAQGILEAMEGIDVVILNGGGCRSDIPIGPIDKDLIATVLPFENDMVLMQLTGAQIEIVLEQAAISVVENDTYGAYPYTAGVRFAADLSSSPYISGVLAGSADETSTGCEEESISGSPLDAEALYTVITNEYLATGGDGYEVFTMISNQVSSGFSDTMLFFNYLLETCPVSSPLFSTYMFTPIEV